MNRLVYFFLFSLFVPFALSSCASMTPATAKRAYCNMLKSDLVFNGATGVTREANIQNSDNALEQRNYNEDNCEE